MMKLRLDFLYRSFSTVWNLLGGLYTHVFYSWAWVRGDSKSSVA